MDGYPSPFRTGEGEGDKEWHPTSVTPSPVGPLATTFPHA